MDENRRISESRDARAGAWATHHQPQHHPAPPPPPPPAAAAPYSQHVQHAQHVSPHQHYREVPPPPPPHPHPHHEASHRPMYPPNGAVPMHHHHQGSHGHGPPPSHAPPPHQAALPAILDDPTRRPSTAESSGSHPSLRPERDRMLMGEHFLPYTPTLIADRDQCAMAVAAFNNGAHPTSGFSFDERQRLFQRIVNLRPTPDRHGGGPPLDAQYMPKSGVGPGTVVEAPFECTYGYNIEIGRDCVINRDVHIYDTCAVQIGDNVVISPGVRLITATYPIDPKERSAKGLGRSVGRSIIIEDNAWIGPQTTILPGVRIGRMSTVGACSVVHKDVPPTTVTAGAPARVLRGIYQQEQRESP